MSWPVTTKNNMLNGQDITQMSLHNDFPGATGAAELTGGTYARQSVIFNPAAGGTRLLNTPVTFTGLPGSVTVRYLGAWNGSTFVGYAPNGGATPKNFVTSTSTGRVLCPSHGYANGQKVAFVFGTAPGGLTTGRIYYVRETEADAFRVSETLGGPAVDFSSTSSPGCWVCAVNEQFFSSAGGTLTVSAASFVFTD